MQEENLDKRIISEISKYVKPVKYSELRDKFTDPDFLERLCFQITIGEIVVIGWGEEESKYPDEAAKVTEIQDQHDIDIIDAKKKIPIEGVKDYVVSYLTGREPEEHDVQVTSKSLEPFLFYKPNWKKLMAYLRGISPELQAKD